MTTPTTRLALSGIHWYRRRLSPLKGFRCAHAALHGGASCSQAVLDIIEARGLTGGAVEIRERFAACRDAYVRLRTDPARPVLGQVTTRGVCCCGPIPIPFRCG